MKEILINVFIPEILPEFQIKVHQNVSSFDLFDILFHILYNIPMVLILWFKKEFLVMLGLFFTECIINIEISNISILYFYANIKQHNKIV
jgi:hypothetical protein